MVYIHIPENLTEEEQMLLAKYAKLKKKVSQMPKKLNFYLIFHFRVRWSQLTE